jgi:hypothetical protein
MSRAPKPYERSDICIQLAVIKCFVCGKVVLVQLSEANAVAIALSPETYRLAAGFTGICREDVVSTVRPGGGEEVPFLIAVI